MDWFVNLFNIIPKVFCEKIFTLTVTRDDVHVMLKAMLTEFDLMELVRILPKEDYLLVLDEAKYFVEDAVVDKMHEVFGLFHKATAAPASMNNGFDFS